ELAHLVEHPPQNMAALMLEFLAFAHKEAGVAYGRSNLVRQLLPTYFVERRTGQLNPRQDIGDLMRLGRPFARPKPSPHPLAPDSDTLARFLAKLLNYDPIRPYPAVALFTLIPTWLRFLQARSLLKPDEANATLADLASLKDDLLAFFASFAGDEGLATAVAHFTESRNQAQNNDDLYMAAYAWRALGSALLRQGDTAAGHKAIQQASQQFAALGLTTEQAKTQQLLAAS
ncbi:MAG: hypothetical protein KC434_20265, partial [Anaerolineales bacterium]|nr:hypothetical protein [Anaerolineales bacterium]